MWKESKLEETNRVQNRRGVVGGEVQLAMSKHRLTGKLRKPTMGEGETKLAVGEQAMGMDAKWEKPTNKKAMGGMRLVYWEVLKPLE